MTQNLDKMGFYSYQIPRFIFNNIVSVYISYHTISRVRKTLHRDNRLKKYISGTHLGAIVDKYKTNIG